MEIKKNKIIYLAIGTIIVLAIILKARNAPQKTESNQPSKVNQPTEIKTNMNNKQLPKPEMLIDENKDYQAVLKTTKGEITIDLNGEETPKTVNNFVYLIRNDFYNQTIFHRVIKGFMIQGGDPKGNGTGGPGDKFNDETFQGEYTRGTVAMANSGPNTNGSQFFIMHKDYNLPKNYVIFGKVSGGMEVIDKIAESEVKPSSTGENSLPVNPTKIKSAKIIEK